MSRNSSRPPKRPSGSSRRLGDEFVRLLEQGARPLVGSEETVVLAVSGGTDSMAMLHGWLECGLPKPAVAHFDHRMRPDSSDDAEFVASAARTLGVPFELGVWTEKPAGRIGEKSARDARYQFLFDAAKRHGAAAVAVAHTRDDQAETVLFRIIRGTGVDGMTGMGAVRPTRQGVRIVRPLLGVRRQVGRHYLTSRGIPFRDDPTNADPRRARNRIRHELLPMLVDRFNPAAVEALARIGDAARDYMAVIAAHVNGLWDSLDGTHGPDEVVIPAARLTTLLPAERTLIVRLLCQRQAWPVGRMTEAAWRRFAAVTCPDGPKGWQGPDGLSAIRTETSFVVRRKG